MVVSFEDISAVMNWVHNSPSIPLFKFYGIPLRAHISFIFLLLLTIASNALNHTSFWFVLTTHGIGWLTSLIASTNHYRTVKAVGGNIDNCVIWPLGGLSPVSFPKSVPEQLRFICDVSGPMVLFPLFMMYFLLNGGHLEPGLGLSNLGVYGPGTAFNLGEWQVVALCASSLMMQLMIMNFLVPLHPLTGWSVLRHFLGGLMGRQGLVTLALLISTGWTYYFVVEGAKTLNFFQLWFALWMMPQLVHMLVGLANGRVDDLPFFAGEEKESVVAPVFVGNSIPQQAYGKFIEDEKTSSNTTSMKIITTMKLPPGTYTIEDGVQ
jgi:hypothetical protein